MKHSASPTARDLYGLARCCLICMAAKRQKNSAYSQFAGNNGRISLRENSPTADCPQIRKRNAEDLLGEQVGTGDHASRS